MHNEEELPSSGEKLSNEEFQVEPFTGIEFPQTYNGLELVGFGVRVKYIVVKASKSLMLWLTLSLTNSQNYICCRSMLLLPI